MRIHGSAASALSIPFWPKKSVTRVTGRSARFAANDGTRFSLSELAGHVQPVYERNAERAEDGFIAHIASRHN